MTADTKFLLRWAGIPLGVLTVLLYVGIYFSTQGDRQELQVAPEIDVKKLASLPKAKVESLFGVPTRSEMCCKSYPNDPLFEVAHYPWGEIIYDESSKFHSIWYNYKNHPHSIEAALKRVGLQKTSEPLRFVNQNRWCPDCFPTPSPALFCGDLKLNVAIFDDRGNDGFEAIDVYFLQWTGQDLLNKPLHAEDVVPCEHL